MKLVQSSLTVAAVIISSRSVYGQWDPDNEQCEDCLEEADKFQGCVEDKCINGDNKEFCLGEAQYLTTSVVLGICCGFGDSCLQSAEKMDTCTGMGMDSDDINDGESCLPSCVSSSINEYFECMDPSDNSCSMEDCVTSIALQNDWIIDPDANSDGGDFFEQLGESLEDVSYSDDCTSTNEKALRVCEIGESCCQGCNPELGMVMHCIVNEVTRPWIKAKSGFDSSWDSSEDECPELSAGSSSDGKDACSGFLDRRQRQLTDTEETTGGDVSDKSAAATEKCMKSMKMNVALGNATAAGSETINCVVVEGARMLEKEEEAPKESNAAASPKSVLSAVFLVVAAASVFA